MTIILPKEQLLKGAPTTRLKAETQAVVRVEPDKQHTNIIVAMQDPLLRSLLAEKLTSDENFRVMSGVSKIDELVDVVADQKPDVLVLDLQWTGASGISMIEK